MSMTMTTAKQDWPSGVRNPLAVVCRGITKEFGSGDSKTAALRGVDVRFASGELSLLVGPSGCGKTTLISIIAGLLDPTAGDVEVPGTNLTKTRPSQLVQFRAKNIGFVFQQYNLLPSLTAAENAAIPLLIAGQPRKKAVAKAADLLGQFGLAARVNSLPSQMS